jgi:hypothetical protein
MGFCPGGRGEKRLTDRQLHLVLSLNKLKKPGVQSNLELAEAWFNPAGVLVAKLKSD